MDEQERQKRLERDALEQGRREYREAVAARRPSQSSSGIDLLSSSLESLATAIAQQQAAIGKGKGKLPSFAVPLISLDPEKLALLTLGSMFDKIVAKGRDPTGLLPTRTELAEVVGGRCRLERYFDKTAGRARDACRELRMRNVHPHHARSRARKQVAFLDRGDWPFDRQWSVGLILVMLAVKHATIASAPVFRVVERRERRENRRRGVYFASIKSVGLSVEAIRWLGARDRSLLKSLVSPLRRPMVVQPRPWTSPRDGGYLTERMNLVKRRSPTIRSALAHADLSRVFAAVNALQDTAWRISEPVYREMEQAWMSGYELPGLHDESVPPDFPRIEGCKTLINEERLYFPYQLDHRGRVYPVPQTFHPQSDDAGRALIEFARGKPLGERGAYWLAVHLANLCGKDKAPFEERIKWVNAHTEEILAFAREPSPDHSFWKDEDVDKPWSLLAACKEWVQYISTGPSFESHLAIVMDGTCNGLQHLSAMARDAEVGKATNLLPTERPSDIYQKVADEVSSRMRSAASNGDEAARLWLGKVTRKLVKQPTMTTPYAVELDGIRQQIWIRLKEDKCDEKKLMTWESTMYLAHHIKKAVDKVVPNARAIKEWLQEVSRCLAKRNTGLKWTLPSGFVAVHEERVPQMREIRVSRWAIRVADDSGAVRIDGGAQRRSVTANFVHSFDAAHLMLTIGRLSTQRLGDFVVIHDGYGVHACDVDAMNRALREEFVAIYREPVLNRFIEEQRRANPRAVLPGPDEYVSLGDLQIEDVVNSDYFFC